MCGTESPLRQIPYSEDVRASSGQGRIRWGVSGESVSNFRELCWRACSGGFSRVANCKRDLLGFRSLVCAAGEVQFYIYSRTCLEQEITWILDAPRDVGHNELRRSVPMIAGEFH